MVCSTPELLTMEMDYWTRFCAGTVTLTGSWKNLTTGLIWTKPLIREPPRNPLSQSLTSRDWAKNLEEYLRTLKSKWSSKGAIHLKLLMHPKDKIPTQLWQDFTYQWTCTNANCNSYYIEEWSRCLESRVKEHNTSSTSAIFQHCTTHNHPKANISQLKIIDEDRKQVSREAREAIHIRRNNPTLSCNIGKLNIPKIFNQLLGTTHNTSADVSTNSNAQRNPSFNHSNRATRETNLHN